MPRISVVIPVKNAEHTLGETLQSLVEQTYRDFDVILINDGSTDRSRQVMDKFRDRLDLHVVDHAVSQGVAASLNQGILASKAEFIARLDADDLARADRLELQVAFMDRHPGIDLCGTDLVMFEGPLVSPNQIRELRHSADHATIVTGMLQRNTIAHPSLLARRSFFIDVGMYDPTFESAEDYELWTRAAERGKKFANLHEGLTFYRLHAGQVSREKHQTQVSRDLAVKRKHLSTLLGEDAGDTLHLFFSPLVSFQREQDAMRVIAQNADRIAHIRARVEDPVEYDRIVAESLVRLNVSSPEPSATELHAATHRPLPIADRRPGAPPRGLDTSNARLAVQAPTRPGTGEQASRIPALLHLIWLGDAALRPDRLIETWVKHHPHWDINLWTLDDLEQREWRAAALIRHHLQDGRPAAATDVMRWEILAEHGGICVAPDSVCLRALDPLRQLRAFAVKRHEQFHPGELCSDYFGCVPGHTLARSMVQAWATAHWPTPTASADEGSTMLSRMARIQACQDLVRLPSDAFMPRHPDRHPPRSGAAPYACEMWAGRLDLYPVLPDIDPLQIILTLQAAGVVIRPASIEARAA